MSYRNWKLRNFFLRPVLLTFGLSMVHAKGIAEDWVPVHEEPRHRLVFENEQAYILDVNLPPGYVSLYHEHKLDLLYVTVTGSTVWAQPLSGEKREVEVATGDLRFSSDNHGLPHIHRVGNVGSAPFHVVGIGIKSGSHPNVESVSGDTVGMQLDSRKDHATVYRIRLNPGEKSGLHKHNLPFTNVYMSAGNLSGVTGNRYAVEAGEFQWHEAGETHLYENVGAEPIEIVEMVWR